MKKFIILCAVVIFVQFVQLSGVEGSEDSDDQHAGAHEQTPQVITDANPGPSVRDLFGFGKTKSSSESSISSSSSSKAGSKSKSSNSKSKDKQSKEDKSDKKEKEGIMSKLMFRYTPCTCAHFACSCCFGVTVPRLKYNAKGCVNLTVDSEDFSIQVDIFAGTRRLYHSKVSAVDPPPMCTFLTVATPVSFCVQFHHDIHKFADNRNIHWCIDFQAKMLTYKVYAVPVGCLAAGQNGIAVYNEENRKMLKEETGSR